MRVSTLAMLGAVAVTTVAITTDASADDKSLAASGAAAAPLSTLATGAFPTLPRGKFPSSIPASEKVPGLFVVQPAFNRKPQGYVMVLADAAEAKQVAAGGGFRGEPPASGAVCFTETQGQGRFSQRGGEENEDPEANNWTSDLRAEVTLVSSVERGERPPVAAVHSERIVTNGTQVSLDAMDAWVDPVTRGTRLIAKTSMPLTAVGTYLDGQERVYAARDGEQVHVVLVRSMSEDARRRSEALFVTAHERIATSGCDHIRTTLRAKKGQAATASIVSSVHLGPPAKKVDDTAATNPAEIRKQMLAQMNDQRSRPMHISPSLSWPSREREALLTVSAGWDAREKNGFGSF